MPTLIKDFDPAVAINVLDISGGGLVAVFANAEVAQHYLTLETRHSALRAALDSIADDVAFAADIAANAIAQDVAPS